MNTCNNMPWHKAIFSSDFGIWIWENHTDLLFFNITYMNMLGYNHTQFPFHISTWINLIHPEDKDRVLSKQYQLFKDPSLGDAFEDKYRMKTASGDYLWILERGFVICRDENGASIRACGMHIEMNIMEEKLEILSLEHDRMLFALEAANDGLWD